MVRNVLLVLACACAPARDEAADPVSLDDAPLTVVDLAASAGVAACAGQSALVVADLDGDGYDDLYQGCSAEAPRLFLHGADAMVDASMRLPARTEAAFVSRGVPAVGDLDADGDLDLVVPAGAGDVGCCGAQQVFENVGPMWIDRAEGLGLQDNARRGRVGLWTDSDRDGALELVVASATTEDGDPEEARLRVWKQTEAGWEDHARRFEADEPDQTGAMLAVDLDADNAPEIVMTSRLGVDGTEPRQPMRVLVPKFGDTERYARMDCRGDNDVITVAAGDFDHDGNTDLAVGRLGAPAEVWRNSARGQSPCVWERTPLGDDTFDATALVAEDLDNDGEVDLLVGRIGASQVPLWLRGRGDLSFDPVPLDFSWSGRPMATWGDLDLDGSAEVVVGTDATSGSAGLMVLDVPSAGRGVVLRLRDDRSANTWGLGARLRVVSEEQTWSRSVQTGGGWRAALPPQVHVGVGSATWVDVAVEWASGAETAVLGLETGRCWELRSDGSASPCA